MSTQRKMWLCIPRGALVAMIVAIGLSGAPSPANAQVDTSITPSLLRRLGEAVDGHRTGRPVYVVAAYQFPHAVVGVFPDRLRASNERERAGPAAYGVFGPYTAHRDIPSGWYYGCRHDGRTSMYLPAICPDRPRLPLQDIAEITISVRTRGGEMISSRFEPGEVDAVFFTLSAIDKFVLPYYERVLGAAQAARMREEMVRRASQ